MAVLPGVSPVKAQKAQRIKPKNSKPLEIGWGGSSQKLEILKLKVSKPIARLQEVSPKQAKNEAQKLETTRNGSGCWSQKFQTLKLKSSKPMKTGWDGVTQASKLVAMVTKLMAMAAKARSSKKTTTNSCKQLPKLKEHRPKNSNPTETTSEQRKAPLQDQKLKGFKTELS